MEGDGRDADPTGNTQREREPLTEENEGTAPECRRREE